MSLRQNFQLMSDYNQWMNNKLYEVSSTLSDEDLNKDQGAFFGSILGTLNHILVADTIWLKRFADHPTRFASLNYLRSVPNPNALNEILYADFSDLRRVRQKMDSSIIALTEQATDADYDHHLAYQNTKGKPYCRQFGFLVHHLFNHQTHHRGQLTTLLGQMRLDYGSTDLSARLPDAM